VKVLGPLEVTVNGQPVDLGGAKQRAVLASLALEPNRVVSVDRLIDDVWGEDPPPRALGSLHVYISNLRRLIEPTRGARAAAHVLVSRAPGYSLVLPVDAVDALRFEQLANDGRTQLAGGNLREAVASFRAALALWRGPVLADVPFATSVNAAAARLEELRRTVVEDFVDARLGLGEHGLLVADLEEMVAAEPLRERRWGQLMLALYRCGRQADALRTYQRVRTQLSDELGLEPGPELQQLEQAVLTQDPALLGVAGRRGSASGDAPLSTFAGQLASSDNPVLPIGREPELAQVDAFLDRVAQGRAAVLVVSGEPGAGKSTMLAEVARRARARAFAIGVGTAPESGPVLPLWPWSEALLEATGDAPFDSGSPASMFADAMTALRRRADTGPVLIVLDDLQWADELTHQLLRVALAGVARHPVALVLGVREPVEDPSPELVATRAALATTTPLTRLVLKGLDRQAIASLAEQVAGEEPSPEVLIAIDRRTGGNPFFVTELVRLLSSEHALQDVDRMGRAGIPVGVRDVVRRRLDRLPESATDLLAAASVLGREVDARILARTAERSLDTTLDLLELAAVANVMAEDEERVGTYTFTHDITREAIYSALPGLRRARLHRAAAGALVAVHGAGNAAVHEIARHAVAAVHVAGPQQALGPLITSARVAQRQHMNELAEAQLRRGLALLEIQPADHDRHRWEVEFDTRLAPVVFHARGDAKEATARLDRARALCPPDDRSLLLDVLLSEGAVAGLWGAIGRSAEAADRAITIAREIGDPQAESDAEYYRAYELWTGPPAGPRRSLERSIALAERVEAETGPPRGAHVARPIKHAMLSVALVLAGDAAAAGIERDRALAAAHRQPNEWTLAWCAGFAMFSAALASDSDAVLTIWADTAEAAAGLPYTDALMEACRAWAEARCGGDASRLHRQRQRLAAAGDGLMQTPFAVLEAELLTASGATGAVAAVEEARAIAERSDHVAWLPRLDLAAAALTSRRS